MRDFRGIDVLGGAEDHVPVPLVDIEPAVLEAADVDDSGRSDLEDGVGLLNFVFRQGEAPPPPLYEALPDLDSDELGCESFGG